MPIKETSKSFELQPYGLLRTSLIAVTVFVFAIIFVLWGYYELTQINKGYIILFIVGALIGAGGLAYLIVRLLKYYSGSLDTITFDIEGIRVHNRKDGIQKSFTWDQNPRISIQEDIETNSADFIIIHLDDSDDRIDISIDRYASFLQSGNKIADRTKKAFAAIRRDYKKSLK
ncbi:MAG TPA: hypothetical protein VMX55_06680 [candidate division Zixibacteria bacterium]|nr:hypothetical protein [candidate division Zixibacteria bacterium]